jgi:hypothetical protein
MRRLDMRFRISTLLAAALILSVLPAIAHHANGPSFDEKKSITLKGVVTRFIFRNPHPYLYFDVTDKGQKTEWVIEFNGATIISKSKGWTKDTVKAGDVIVATGRPSFVGHAMHVDTMSRGDGSKIY